MEIVPAIAKAFFQTLDKEIGPFDRPFQFHPFPFDAGGSLNFLTVGAGREEFVTYVSWDLLGHPEQKRGALGRYELLAVCNNAEWCADVLTNVGRQGLEELLQPGDTMDIAGWVGASSALQGLIFEEGLRVRLEVAGRPEACGLLRCIGVCRSELEYAMRHGVRALAEHLARAEVYPRTALSRAAIELPPG